MTNDQLRKRVLSGIQPTGRLHLGNLIGAVENWVKLQNEYDCFFFIADFHALTTAYADTKNLKEDIKQVAIDLLSAGLAPEKCILFKQSDVPQHTELHLILSLITPLAWLERVPSYKSKIEELKGKDLRTYGFLGYPVLQAADILIYKAVLVPVGEDQLPHLELTREIARRFNYLYGETFLEPKEDLTEFPLLPGTDGRKMSKSYQNTIAISEPPDVVREKVASMVTDPGRIKRHDPGRPAVCPVYAYYNVFAKDRQEKITLECKQASRGCVECKQEMAEILIAYLAPIQAKRKSLEQNPESLERILVSGAAKAREVAARTLAEARRVVGIS